MRTLPCHFFRASVEQRISLPRWATAEEIPSLIVYTSNAPHDFLVGWEAHQWIIENNWDKSACFFLKMDLDAKPFHLEFKDGSTCKRLRSQVVGDYLSALCKMARAWIDSLIHENRLPEDARDAIHHLTLSQPAKPDKKSSYEQAVEAEGEKNEFYKEVVKLAIEGAGLQNKTLYFYEEPLATYQAFLEPDLVRGLEPEEKSLIVDIGAGSTDLALVEGLPAGDAAVRTADEGGQWTAGFHIDQLLWQLLQQKMKKANSFHDTNHRMYVETAQPDQLKTDYFLWLEVEEKKRELVKSLLDEKKDSATLHLTLARNGRAFEQDVEVTREEFEKEVVEPVLREISNKVQSFCGVDGRALSQIYLTGGSSHIKRFYSELDNNLEPKLGVLSAARLIDPKTGKKDVGDISKNELTGVKGFVCAGCALRRSQLKKRIRLLNELRENDSLEIQQELRELQLLNPTLRDTIVLEVRIGNHRYRYDLHDKAGKVPLPFRKVFKVSNSVPVKTKRERCQLTVKASTGEVNEKFSVGLQTDLEVENYVAEILSRKPEWSDEAIRTAANNLVRNLIKSLAGRRDRDIEKHLEHSTLELLNRRMEFIEGERGVWCWTTKELVKRLLERVDQETARDLLQQIDVARNRHQHPFVDAFEHVFKKHLSVYLDVQLAEDGLLQVGICYASPATEGIEYRKRQLYLRCFTPDHIDEELDDKFPWSLGVDFGTFSSMIAIAVPE